MKFPEAFAWGAATASYQIEGAACDDGKGASIWDVFCRQPGRIRDGDHGDTACDHYHRFREDVRLMAGMGLRAYRFSVSWPRVLPEGTGRVNKAGLDFYERLVDALLEQGIEPWVTLFHWDYPYALFCRGGWLARDSAAWFADYTRLMADRLSDRVTHWITLNEPQVFLSMGHASGTHAPGLKLGPQELRRAAHHVLLAHGRAVEVLRAGARRPPAIGFAPVGVVKIPATETPADIDAARRAMFSVGSNFLGSNTWFCDQVFRGVYPEDGPAVELLADKVVNDGDMACISQPLDFFGCNIYNGQVVCAGPQGLPEKVAAAPGPATTTMGWNVRPESLYWGPRFFHERYGKPLVITENGMANPDWEHPGGRVHDPQRIDFTRRYLRELGRAVEEGIPVQGYMHWSLLDNFEWQHGYRQRFGLIYVEYSSGRRLPKDSAAWYAQTIATNGSEL